MAHIKLKGNIEGNRRIVNFGRQRFIIPQYWIIIPDDIANQLNREIYDIVIGGDPLETKKSKTQSAQDQEKELSTTKKAFEKEIVKEPTLNAEEKEAIKERVEDVLEDLKDDGKRNYSHDPRRKSPGRKKKVR